MAGNNHEDDPLLAGTGETVDPARRQRQQAEINPGLRNRMQRVATAPGHLNDGSRSANPSLIGAGSIAALTSLDGDGLNFDDPGGVYIRENENSEQRVSILDPALQANTPKMGEEQGFFQKICKPSNALKILLIIVTIGIYTGGPMLNSMATKVPGIQFDYLDQQTRADFFELTTKADGTQVYERQKNGAKSTEFWSVDEYTKKNSGDDKDKNKDHLQLKQVYETAQKTANKRSWVGRVMASISGEYGLFAEGKGNFKVAITVTDPELAKTAKNNGATTDFSQNLMEFPDRKDFNKKGTAAVPVLLPDCSGAIDYRIDVEFTGQFATDDFLQIKYYLDNVPTTNSKQDIEARCNTGRPLQFWKQGDKSDKAAINSNLAKEAKGEKPPKLDYRTKNGKVDGDSFGENPQGKPSRWI